MQVATTDLRVAAQLQVEPGDEDGRDRDDDERLGGTRADGAARDRTVVAAV
jgi:hypothetical protein